MAHSMSSCTALLRVCRSFLKKFILIFSQTDTGLCFLGMGGGMLIGSLFTGKVMDAYYRKIRDDLMRESRTDSEKHIDSRAIEEDPSFLIEKARLQLMPIVVFVYTACVIGYPVMAGHFNRG